MVSQAGAMALAGLLPAVHSFACFLSTRPNEQIYNNATEGTKVIYAGSLAGLVPGGPGPLAPVRARHLGARRDARHGADRAAAASTRPALAVDWAVREARGLRLHPARVRAVGARLRAAAVDALVPGRGTVLRDGSDALLVAAGPGDAVAGVARGRAARADGDRARRRRAAVAARTSTARGWRELAGGAPIFCLDNHYIDRRPGRRACSPRSRRIPTQRRCTSSASSRCRSAGRTTRCCARTGSTRRALAERVEAALPARRS